MLRVLSIALLALLTLSGCAAIQAVQDVADAARVVGSGVIVEDERLVGAFEELQADNAIEVTVDAGQDQRVVVTGDDNIVPLVRTTVSGGRLTVGYAPNTTVQPSEPVVVRIAVPDLTFTGASGASRVALSGLRSDALELQASGASRITAAGAGSKLKIGASGASRVEAVDLPAWEASVEASGASSVSVDVSDRLEAEASGASNVCYRTEPAAVDANTSGASTVDQCS